MTTPRKKVNPQEGDQESPQDSLVQALIKSIGELTKSVTETLTPQVTQLLRSVTRHKWVLRVLIISFVIDLTATGIALWGLHVADNANSKQAEAYRSAVTKCVTQNDSNKNTIRFLDKFLAPPKGAQLTFDEIAEAYKLKALEEKSFPQVNCSKITQ